MNYENKTNYWGAIGLSFMMGFVSYNIIFQQVSSYGTAESKVINTGKIGIGTQKNEVDRDRLQQSSGSVQGDMKKAGYNIQPTTTKQGKSKSDQATGSQGVKYSLIRKGWSTGDIRQQYVQYAYDIGGWNLVLLNECENAKWTLDRKGDGGLAIGMCQIQLYRYDDIDKQRYKTDWKYQLDTCWKKRSSGTLFYGPTRKINGQYCYNYVRDRFILTTN